MATDALVFSLQIALEAVPLPKGASLRIQDPSLLVLKIMGRVARGAADAVRCSPDASPSCYVVVLFGTRLFSRPCTSDAGVAEVIVDRPVAL